MHVAVTEYDGYAFSPEITAKAARLNEDIEASSDVREDPSQEGAFYFAGYDSPYHTTHRHNEDWVPVLDVN